MNLSIPMYGRDYPTAQRQCTGIVPAFVVSVAVLMPNMTARALM